MLYILWYLVTGNILIFVVAFAHLIRAELKGYAALDWWYENGTLINSDATPASSMLGLVIWPIRIGVFYAVSIPKLYSMYELK